MLTRRRAALSVSAAALTLALLSGCAVTAPSSASIASTTVESAYGEVTVPQQPERIAAVSYDTPWQLMSLDVKPVATIDYSRWADSFTTAQMDWISDAATVGTFGEINFEALTAARPDVIIGTADEIDQATYERLSAIAPTVVTGGVDRGDWQSITRQTAAATGTTATWEAEKAAFEKLRDDTRQTYRDVIEGNRWINFSFGDEPGQFSVQLPTGSTGDLVVNEMGLAYGPGAASLPDTDGRGYTALPLEQLPTVFDGVTVALTFSSADGTPDPTVSEIVNSPLFQTLPVAQSGHVYGMRSTVTDYVTAQDWVHELVDTVLEPLQK
ncbi:iron complex transport system substrate-binding protein [Microbacterium testaceum]|uniref:ABC transporter substrate-binding protein n=1 Tax=Microbacterium testaceum TaxID=2033 RepID=UPI002783B0D5|nr:ABC transporter substrate-binding protein [Microbacterium testaceum]MDQ1116806.1 iron complex transport system substrate-binding protein [Microbacterium testaceum]